MGNGDIDIFISDEEVLRRSEKKNGLLMLVDNSFNQIVFDRNNLESLRHLLTEKSSNLKYLFMEPGDGVITYDPIMYKRAHKSSNYGWVRITI